MGDAKYSADDPYSFACPWERHDETWSIANLGGDRSVAKDGNNLGQIVGSKYIAPTTRACLWERVNGQWITRDLGLPSSFSYTIANAINNSGQVVGYANLVSGGQVGFLYKDGVMHDLNSFLPTGSGWWLMIAHDNNDQGQIVGVGRNPAGVYHGFVMDTKQATYSYTSTGSAVAIKDNASASKAMTLTDANTIADLNVTVNLNHARYADLKIELIGPNNVTRVLCNANGLTGSGTKTLVFDDDGAAGTIKPVNALSYYDGTSTQGTWTLRISDTVKNSKTGSFTSFTLDVVPAL